MEVTNAMVHAAVKVAVKGGMLPTHSDMDTYTHHYETVQKMIEAAIEKEGQEL
jgi:hypothetical protein